MKKRSIAIFSLALLILAFRSIETHLFLVPQNWPKPVYNFKNNPLTPQKINLGKVLFYDPILSRDSSISCNSCHSQYNAFTHVDHTLSHGIKDRIGSRNSPALMNLAWQTSFMWDGAVNHLDVQALAPITHRDEMDETIEHISEKLQRSTYYKKLFSEAFGDSLVTGERTLKSLSQFMLTFVSSNSKYDSVMRKQAEFTAQEKSGYEVFKINCSSCHTEPLFTNGKFENNGLPIDPKLKDAGRMKISQDPADSAKFKVPSLRNIEFTFPYMHDGRFQSLSQVLQHYGSGISHSAVLAEELRSPLKMSIREKVDLTAFLLTLSDRHFLFNPEYSYLKHNLK